MSRPCLLAAGALALALAAGCGDDPAPDAGRTATTAEPVHVTTGPSRHLKRLDRGAEGLHGQSVCTVLPPRALRNVLARRDLDPGRLRARRNDSLNLSICRYGRGDANVRIIVDAGGHAGRRYFEQQAEMTQKFVRDPGLRPQLVRHVGDDRAWANAGAHWTPDFHMLVAQKGGHIVRVTFNVPASDNRARRAAAADVARAVFARLGRGG